MLDTDQIEILRIPIIIIILCDYRKVQNGIVGF